MSNKIDIDDDKLFSDNSQIKENIHHIINCKKKKKISIEDICVNHFVKMPDLSTGIKNKEFVCDSIKKIDLEQKLIEASSSKLKLADIKTNNKKRKYKIIEDDNINNRSNEIKDLSIMLNIPGVIDIQKKYPEVDDNKETQKKRKKKNNKSKIKEPNHPQISDNSNSFSKIDVNIENNYNNEINKDIKITSETERERLDSTFENNTDEEIKDNVESFPNEAMKLYKKNSLRMTLSNKEFLEKCEKPNSSKTFEKISGKNDQNNQNNNINTKLNDSIENIENLPIDEVINREDVLYYLVEKELVVDKSKNTSHNKLKLSKLTKDLIVESERKFYTDDVNSINTDNINFDTELSKLKPLTLASKEIKNEKIYDEDIKLSKNDGLAITNENFIPTTTNSTIYGNRDTSICKKLFQINDPNNANNDSSGKRKTTIQILENLDKSKESILQIECSVDYVDGLNNKNANIIVNNNINNRRLHLDSYVNNISITPNKTKRENFSDLCIDKKEELTIDKTSKAEKIKLNYEENIQKLREEIKRKEMEKHEIVNEMSNIKNDLINAENYRMELHKFIQEFKGNVRIFLRIRKSNIIINENESYDLNKGENKENINSINVNINNNNQSQTINNSKASNSLISKTKQIHKSIISSNSEKIKNPQTSNLKKNEFKSNSFNNKNQTQFGVKKPLIANNNVTKIQNNNRSAIKTSNIDKTVDKEVKKLNEKNNNQTVNNDKATNKEIVKIQPKINSKKYVETLTLINPENDQSSTYQFNCIFDDKSKQSEVFDEVKPLVISALDGENICIFAYGPTGSGKTYTMQGDIANLLINEDSLSDKSGILPRTAFFLYEEFQRRHNSGQRFSMMLSAIEIYNENIFDLLDETTTEKKSYINGFIKGLKWEEIKSKQDIVKLVQKAGESRTTDKTIYNSVSSRSHAIFQLKIEIKNYNIYDPSVITKIRNSYINIVDLAGSEKCSYNPGSINGTKELEQMKKTQNEANFINKSLTTLGRVITLLAEKSKQNPPYRDSKLTLLLQNSLSTINSKTALIVTINNSPENYGQIKDCMNFSKNAMIAL